MLAHYVEKIKLLLSVLYIIMCFLGYSTSSGLVVQNSGYIPLNRT